ncbi:hypothetical protein [Neobacillus niacini]|nr:hypothetical protein [Neobacillus niacini]
MQLNNCKKQTHRIYGFDALIFYEKKDTNESEDVRDGERLHAKL